MEVVAAASSIVTLLQLVASIKKTIQFLIRYKDSPSDFRRISDQLDDLSDKLRLLKMLGRSAIDLDSLVQEPELDMLKTTLLATQKEVSDVYNFCLKYEGSNASRGKRIMWALRDSRAWNKHASRLQRAHSSLAMTIQLIDLKFSVSSRNETVAATDHILAELRLVRERLSHITDERITNVVTIDSNSMACATANKIVRKRKPGFLQPGWVQHGMQIALTVVKGSAPRMNRLAIKMPVPAVTRKLTFVFDLTLRKYLFYYPDILFHFAIRNIIPTSSEIITACRNQDLTTVQEIFLQRKARPNDMTKDFRPLLWYAIDSGSVEVVDFLLSVGADATMLSGTGNAGLLHIAFYSRRAEIARLLISKGADTEQVNDFRTTALFHLFQPGHDSSKTPALEYFEIMCPSPLSGVNIQSCQGRTVLHRAAAYGTSEDIDGLVERGADMTLKTYDLHWTPIFMAVSNNNINTFKRLASLSAPGFVEDRDIRGWTMLHIAADVGSPELVKLLIDHGADPHASIRPKNDCISDKIPLLQRTPTDLARKGGTDKFHKYIFGLRDAGIDVEVDAHDDVFWPAGD